MAGHAGTGALREIFVVLVLAVSGLFLALLVAFTPWYAALGLAEKSMVVELHAPDAPQTGTELTSAGG
ncbi:hypothetical protein AB0J86_21890 [Micromonospora sp. NPDC049559]|uniref:hypothetical protein n=1 Tax=Micromonospora sp. NPDC049559 TaxID=3155923 RepID=UPI00341AA3EC